MINGPIASRTSLLLRALLIITSLLLGAAAVYGLVRTLQANRGPSEIVNTITPSPIASLDTSSSPSPDAITTTSNSTPGTVVPPLPKLTPTSIPSGNTDDEGGENDESGESEEDEEENNEEEDD